MPQKVLSFCIVYTSSQSSFSSKCYYFGIKNMHHEAQFLVKRTIPYCMQFTCIHIYPCNPQMFAMLSIMKRATYKISDWFFFLKRRCLLSTRFNVRLLMTIAWLFAIAASISDWFSPNLKCIWTRSSLSIMKWQ